MIYDSTCNGAPLNLLSPNRTTWYEPSEYPSYGGINALPFNAMVYSDDPEDELDGQGCYCTIYGNSSAVVPAGTTVALVTSKLYQSGFPGIATIFWNDIPRDDEATMFQGCSPGNAVITQFDHVYTRAGVQTSSVLVINMLTGAEILIDFVFNVVLSSPPNLFYAVWGSNPIGITGVSG